MDFVLLRDMAALEPGRYDIDGDRIFASLSEAATGPAASRLFENHTLYTDIQIVLAGKERHGFFPGPPAMASGCVPVRDEMAEKDLAFYTHPEDAVFFTLAPMQYAVYFPEELHCPLCAAGEPETVRKVVLKIRTDAITA